MADSRKPAPWWTVPRSPQHGGLKEAYHGRFGLPLKVVVPGQIWLPSKVAVPWHIWTAADGSLRVYELSGSKTP
jgi:hypothetical protein